ncbi:MAG: Conserved hypothetical integral membrane protein YrbEa, partial [uncultured Solirubrobacteraceae bacterium]
GPQRRRSSVSSDEEPARRGRGHDDPHGQDDHVRPASAVPLRRRVRQPVPLRPEALLVSAARLDGRLRLRRAGPAGGELPGPVRRDRPPRRVLRARLDPRVRAVRDRDRAGGGGGHRDHRRSRRAQDPRGARRAAGARHRPDQEPRRAALPRAHARDGVVQRLRAAVRRLRRRAGDARQPGAAGRLLGELLRPGVADGPVGLDAEDDVVRGDHRDRLLLQGDDGVRRGRGSRPRGQPGGGHRLPGHLRVQLRLHPDAARDQSRAGEPAL